MSLSIYICIYTYNTVSIYLSIYTYPVDLSKIKKTSTCKTSILVMRKI